MGSRNEEMTGTVEGIIENFMGEIEALRDEMTEWQESMEGAEMEHLPKYEEVAEAAQYCEEVNDAMEGIEMDQLDPAVKAQPVTYTQDTRKKATSRSYRMGNVMRALEAVKDVVEEQQTAIQNKLDDLDPESPADVPTYEALEARLEIVTDTVNQLEEAIGAGECICFPGMF